MAKQRSSVLFLFQSSSKGYREFLCDAGWLQKLLAYDGRKGGSRGGAKDLRHKRGCRTQDVSTRPSIYCTGSCRSRQIKTDQDRGVVFSYTLDALISLIKAILQADIPEIGRHCDCSCCAMLFFARMIRGLCGLCLRRCLRRCLRWVGGDGKLVGVGSGCR